MALPPDPGCLRPRARARLALPVRRPALLDLSAAGIDGSACARAALEQCRVADPRWLCAGGAGCRPGPLPVSRVLRTGTGAQGEGNHPLRLRAGQAPVSDPLQHHPARWLAGILAPAAFTPGHCCHLTVPLCQLARRQASASGRGSRGPHAADSCARARPAPISLSATPHRRRAARQAGLPGQGRGGVVIPVRVREDLNPTVAPGVLSRRCGAGRS
jgi:hypothetical protein